MPDIETDDLFQSAVLWAVAGTDDNGRSLVDAPVQISCRVEKGQRLLNSAQSQLTMTDMVIKVDRSIAINSILWLGIKAELPTGTADPDNLLIVSDYQEVPDVKGIQFERWVTANFFMDALPSLA